VFVHNGEKKAQWLLFGIQLISLVLVGVTIFRKPKAPLF